MTTKVCTHCGQEKIKVEFRLRFYPSRNKSWYNGKCRKCESALALNRHFSNHEESKRKARERMRNYWKTDPEKMRKRRADAYRANPEHARELKRKSWKRNYRRRFNDPSLRLMANMRTRLFHALQNGTKKATKTRALIGCTVHELMTHLEGQFKPGMSWANYGKWHVDHRLPVSSFDLLNPEAQRACFHYTNLQPLWAVENIRKSDKLA